MKRKAIPCETAEGLSCGKNKFGPPFPTIIGMLERPKKDTHP
jgi:hypothetical protein